MEGKKEPDWLKAGLTDLRQGAFRLQRDLAEMEQQFEQQKVTFSLELDILRQENSALKQEILSGKQQLGQTVNELESELQQHKDDADRQLAASKDECAKAHELGRDLTRQLDHSLQQLDVANGLVHGLQEQEARHLAQLAELQQKYDNLHAEEIQWKHSAETLRTESFSTLSDAEVKIQALQAQLTESKSESEQRQARIDELLLQLELAKVAETLSATNAAQSEQAWQQKLTAAEEKLQSSQSDAATAVEALQLQVTECSAAVESLLQRLQAEADENASLHASKKSLENEVAELMESLAVAVHDHDAYVADSSAQIKKLRAESNHHTRAAQSELAETREFARRESVQLQQQITDAQREYTKAHSQIAEEHTVAVSKLSQELEELQQQYERAVADTHSSSAVYEAQLAAAREENVALTQHSEALEMQLAAVQAEMQPMQGLHSKLAEHASSLEHEHAQRDDFLAKLQAELQTSQQQGEALQTDKLQLQTEVESLRASLSDLTSRCEADLLQSHTECETLQHQLSELHTACSQLQSDSAESASQLVLERTQLQTTTASLSQELQTCRDSLTQVEQQLVSVRQEASQLKSDLTVAQTSKSALDAELEDTRLQWKSSQQRENELQQQVREVEALLATAKETSAAELQALKQQLAENVHELETVEADRDAKLSEAQRQFSELTRQHEAALQTGQERVARITELERLLHLQSEEHKTVQQQQDSGLSMTKGELQTLREQHRVAAERLEQITQQLHVAESQLTAARADASQFSGQLQALRTQYDGVLSELAESARMLELLRAKHATAQQSHSEKVVELERAIKGLQSDMQVEIGALQQSQQQSEHVFVQARQQQDEERKQLQDVILRAENERDTSQSALAHLQEQLIQATSERTAMIAERDELRAEHAKLQADLKQVHDDRTSSNTELGTRLAQCQAECDRLTQTIAFNKSAHEQEIAQMQSRQASLQSTHEAHVAGTAGQIEAITTQVAVKAQQVQQLLSQLESAKSQIEALKSELDAMRNSAASAVETFQANANARIDEARQNAKASQDQVEQLQQEIRDLHSATDVAKRANATELEQTNNARVAVERELETTRQQLAARVHELDAVEADRTAKLAEAQLQFESVKRQWEETQQLVLARDVTIEQLEAKLQQQGEQQRALQQEREVSLTHAKSDLEAVHVQLQQLHEQHRTVTASLERATQESQLLQTQLTAARDETSQAAQRLAVLQSQHDTVVADLASSRTLVESLRAEHLQAQQLHSDKMAEMDLSFATRDAAAHEANLALQAQLAASQQMQFSLQQQLGQVQADLQLSLHQREEDRAHTQSIIEAGKYDLSRTAQALQETKDVLTQLTTKQAHYDDQLKLSSEDNAVLREEVRSRNEELLVARKDLEDVCLRTQLEIDGLRSALVEEEGTVQLLEQERTTMRIDYNTLCGIRLELEQEIEALKAELALLIKERDDLAVALAAAQAQHVELSSQLSESQVSVFSLRQELTATQHTNISVVTQIESQLTMANSLAKELQAECDSSRQQIKLLRNDVSDACAQRDAVKEQLAQAQQVLADTTASTTVLQQSLTSVSSQQQQSTADIRALQEQLTASNAAAFEAESKHAAEVQHWLEVNKNLEKQLSYLQNHHTATSVEKDSLQEQFNVAKEELAETSHQLGQQSAELVALQSKFSSVSASLAEAEATLTELRQQFAESQTQLAAASDSSSQRQGVIAELQSQLHSLEEEHLQLTQANAALRDTLHQTSAELAGNVKELQAKLEGAQQQLANAQTRSADLQSALTEAREQIVEKTAEQRDAQKRCDQLEEDVRTAKQQCFRVQSELQLEQANSHSLASQLEAAQQAHAKQEETLARTRSEYSLLLEQDARSRGTLLAREEQLTQLQSQLASTAERSQQLQAELFETKQASVKLDAAIKEKSVELAHMQASLLTAQQQHQAEVATWLSAKEALSTSLEQTRVESTKRGEQCSELQQQLRQAQLDLEKIHSLRSDLEQKIADGGSQRQQDVSRIRELEAVVCEQSSKLQQLSSECSTVNAELSELQASLVLSQKQAALADGQVIQLQQTCDKQVAQIDVLNGTLTSKTGELMQTSAYLSSVTEQLKSLSVVHEEMEKRLEVETRSSNELKLHLQALQTELSALKTERDQLQSQMQSSEETASVLQSKLTVAEASVAQNGKDASEQLAHIARLEQSIAERNNLILQLQQDTKESHTECARLQDEVVQTELQLLEARTTVTAVTSDRDRLVAEHAVVARELGEKLDSMTTQLEEQQRTNNDLNAQLTRLEEEHRQAFVLRRQQLSQKETMVAQLTAQLEQLQQGDAAHRETILAAEKKQLATLRELGETTQQLSVLSSAKEQVDAELARVRAALHSLETKYADLKSKYQHEAAQLAQRTEDVRLAQGQASAYAQQAQLAQESVSQRDQQIVLHQTQTSQLTQQVKTLSTTLVEQGNELENKQRVINELSVQLSTHTRQFESLQVSMKQTASDYDKVNKDFVKLLSETEQMRNAQAKLRDAEAEVARTRAEHDALQIDLATVRAELTRVQADLNDISNRHLLSHDELATLQRTLAERDGVLGQMQSELLHTKQMLQQETTLRLRCEASLQESLQGSSQLQANVSQLVGDNEHANTTARALAEQVHELRREAESLQESLKRQKQTIDLEAEHRQAAETELQLHKLGMDKMEQQLALYIDQQHQAMKLVEDRGAQIDVLQRSEHALRQELMSIKDATHSEKTELQHQIESLKQQVASLKSALEQRDAAVTQLRTASTQSQAEVRSVRDTLAQAAQDRDSSVRKCSELTQQLKEAQASLAEQVAKVQHLQSITREKEHRLNELQTELQRAAARHANDDESLLEKLAAAERMNAQLSSTLANAVTSRAQALAEMQNAKTSLNDLTQQLQSSQLEVSTLQQRMDESVVIHDPEARTIDWNARLEQLQATLHETQIKYQNAVKELTHVRSQQAQLDAAANSALAQVRSVGGRRDPTSAQQQQQQHLHSDSVQAARTSQMRLTSPESLHPLASSAVADRTLQVSPHISPVRFVDAPLTSAKAPTMSVSSTTTATTSTLFTSSVRSTSGTTSVADDSLLARYPTLATVMNGTSHHQQPPQQPLGQGQQQKILRSSASSLNDTVTTGAGRTSASSFAHFDNVSEAALVFALTAAATTDARLAALKALRQHCEEGKTAAVLAAKTPGLLAELQTLFASSPTVIVQEVLLLIQAMARAQTTCVAAVVSGADFLRRLIALLFDPSTAQDLQVVGSDLLCSCLRDLDDVRVNFVSISGATSVASALESGVESSVYIALRLASTAPEDSRLTAAFSAAKVLRHLTGVFARNFSMKTFTQAAMACAALTVHSSGATASVDVLVAGLLGCALRELQLEKPEHAFRLHTAHALKELVMMPQHVGREICRNGGLQVLGSYLCQATSVDQTTVFSVTAIHLCLHAIRDVLHDSIPVEPPIAAVVESLFTLLSSEESQVSFGAAGALAILSDLARVRAVLRSRDALALFLQLLLKGKQLRLVAQVTTCVRNMCAEESCRLDVAKREGVPLLLSLMVNTNTEVLTNAIGGLRALTQSSEIVTQVVGAANSCLQFVQLLGSLHEEIRVGAAACIANIAQQDDGRTALRQAGALHALVQVVSGTPTPVVAYALKAITACAKQGMPATHPSVILIRVCS
eukprot:TRINITY_DN1414_c0_g1_i1.p1 TRINITY_DN1414_c0_g1~~TRINITY_DN1414_c0_g1_i1.p1  ORF type:complete len:3665 (-),score=1172.69 TRINITY_DN1414_c0_g1_i1:91-11085(-)